MTIMQCHVVYQNINIIELTGYHSDITIAAN